MKARILLVEDDLNLSATLHERLVNEGYLTTVATTKSEAHAAFDFNKKNGGFDLLLLDIGLPDGSGLDFARDVRIHSSIPIVFLSAMNSASYRLEGFEIGAEDYVPKPFHLKELLLRVQKVLARAGVEGKVSFGSFAIDFGSHTLQVEDQEKVFFSGKDFEVLKYLVEAHPRVVSRQELIKYVWREAEDSQSGRTVDNCVMRLRQQLKPFAEDCIRSARGVGYQWIVDRS